MWQSKEEKKKIYSRPINKESSSRQQSIPSHGNQSWEKIVHRNTANMHPH